MDDSPTPSKMRYAPSARASDRRCRVWRLTPTAIRRRVRLFLTLAIARRHKATATNADTDRPTRNIEAALNRTRKRGQA